MRLKLLYKYLLHMIKICNSLKHHLLIALPIMPYIIYHTYTFLKIIAFTYEIHKNPISDIIHIDIWF